MFAIYTQGNDELPPVVYADEWEMEDDGWFRMFDRSPETMGLELTYFIREENILYIEAIAEEDE